MALFKYNWQNFDSRLGLIFMVSCLVFFNILGVEGFPVFAAGFAALLAWITIILAPGFSRRTYLLGIVALFVVGAALTTLTGYLYELDNDWLWLGSVGIVSFAGFASLRWGAHVFMVGWCLVYWYLLVPLFFGDGGLRGMLVALAAGTGLVFLLNLVPYVWSRVSSNGKSGPDGSRGEQDPEGSWRYAVFVALSLVAGTAAGLRWLVTDPTIISNATLNMITPSLRQTWVTGLERIILGAAGIIIGFYLGWYLAGPVTGQLLIAFCSFFALGALFVNAGLVVGTFFVLVAYSWGSMQTESAHLIANEKIVGEIVGVLIAVLAIAVLSLTNRRRS